MVPQFFVSTEECSRGKTVEFSHTRGIIQGFTNKQNFTGKRNWCYLYLKCPAGMFIRAYSQIVNKHKPYCTGFTRMTACYRRNCTYTVGKWACNLVESLSKSPLLLPQSSKMFVRIDYATISNDFWLYFEAIARHLRTFFNVVKDSETTGSITTPGFDHQLRFPRNLEISYVLLCPRNHSVMLSFPYFHMCLTTMFNEGGRLLLSATSIRYPWRELELWQTPRFYALEASIYKTSLLFRFTSFRFYSAFGFKGLFSYHPEDQAPHKHSSGLFNCSTHYDTFHQHLDCNLKVECQNQEDEREHCPFYNPLCKGSAYIQVRQKLPFFLAFFLSFVRSFFLSFFHSFFLSFFILY